MRRFLIVLFFISGIHLQAQNLGELQSMNAKAKFQFVQPEVLDRLMAGMRLYESHPVAGQDSLMLDTYNAVISGYMANNHFKQAYESFNRYLHYKESMLSKQKAEAISKTINSVSARQSTDDKQQSELQNQLSSLMKENVDLDSKRVSFKRNFSFALIVLSAIFAIMLVSGGIKLMNLRTEVTRSHDRMKEIHRSAVTGKLSNGIQESFNSSVASIEMQAKELKEILKSQEQFAPAKQASGMLTAIVKSLSEFKK
jgi:hypothetical protein